MVGASLLWPRLILSRVAIKSAGLLWSAGSTGTTRGAGPSQGLLERTSPDLPAEGTGDPAGVLAGGVAEAREAADAADETGLPVVVLCPLGLASP
jgi:hypothetical protein